MAVKKAAKQVASKPAAKAAAKPAAKAAAKPAAAPAAGKAATKTQIVAALSESTQLAKKDVQAVIDGLSEMVKKDMGRRGPGVFTIPGLVKLKVVKKPARKAREGVNPFTGEKMMFKAKPAYKVVKAMVLKGIKDIL
ncbi:MAG: DNA-binding protein HU [candidate division BRC1 bacterium ADurb.BinA364]|nr:MAG: DNA-binding protein HU [candidate division BRC1 bacterium ADurb.BinA364]